jgi:hypothetical protein
MTTGVFLLCAIASMPPSTLYGCVFQGIGAAMAVPCELHLKSVRPLSRKPIAYQVVGRSDRDTLPGQRYEVSGHVIETRHACPANQRF